MKHYKLGVGVTVCVLSLFWFFTDDSQAKSNTVSTNNGQTRESSAESIVQIVNKAEQRQAQLTSHFDGSIKLAAKQVAVQYEAALRYPQYSQPLTRFDEDRLKPNAFYPLSIPLDESGNKLTMRLEKYRFVYPDHIELEIGGDNIENIAVSLMDVETKKIFSQRTIYGEQLNDKIVFSGDKSYSRNLQIVAHAKIKRKQVPIVAQIQYMPPSARLVGFGDARPDDDKMSIPAKLQVEKAGLYRVRANLYAAGEPIAHLVTRGLLRKGQQSIDLSAHWSVLNPDIETMTLSGFVVELMSPSPAQPSIFGASDIKEFDITEFAYDSLQQTPYEPLAKERQSLTFLQHLAGNSE
ncbi:hypothetical protein J8L98_15000 [Pseudoalteromonas sp. MMG013]|uniref:hypothetical protein n=1 Tax=Pseudoalteromonas sp. MMG013 TaxID=2822687 RepID=UPI001B37AAB0|nr:hypothetical protein [Pseudoalteromonas sp. MMG013]MBQ4862994.1 hypothetical protein [Pseudoalteromonas sp. MMG013]